MCQQNYSCLAFVGMAIGRSSDGYAEITIQVSMCKCIVYVCLKEGEYYLQQRSSFFMQGKFIMCQQNYSCLAFVGMAIGRSSDGYAEITIQVRN